MRSRSPASITYSRATIRSMPGSKPGSRPETRLAGRARPVFRGRRAEYEEVRQREIDQEADPDAEDLADQRRLDAEFPADQNRHHIGDRQNRCGIGEETGDLRADEAEIR